MRRLPWYGLADRSDMAWRSAGVKEARTKASNSAVTVPGVSERKVDSQGLFVPGRATAGGGNPAAAAAAAAAAAVAAAVAAVVVAVVNGVIAVNGAAATAGCEAPVLRRRPGARRWPRLRSCSSSGFRAAAGISRERRILLLERAMAPRAASRMGAIREGVPSAGSGEWEAALSKVGAGSLVTVW